MATEWSIRIRSAIRRKKIVADDAVGVSITFWRRVDGTGWCSFDDAELGRINFVPEIPGQTATSILRLVLDELRRIGADEDEIVSKRRTIGFQLPAEETGGEAGCCSGTNSEESDLVPPTKNRIRTDTGASHGDKMVSVQATPSEGEECRY